MQRETESQRERERQVGERRFHLLKGWGAARVHRECTAGSAQQARVLPAVHAGLPRGGARCAWPITLTEPFK